MSSRKECVVTLMTNSPVRVAFSNVCFSSPSDSRKPMLTATSMGLPVIGM